MVLRGHLAALAAMSVALAAQAGQPSFEQFAVSPDSTPNHFTLQLSDPQSREFEAMLRDAAEGRPNFAGHYILASWGCGASCVMAAAIDTHDGSVVWLPFTVCCWRASEPLTYTLQSRLVVVHGGRNEEGSGTHFTRLRTAGSRPFPPAGWKDEPAVTGKASGSFLKKRTKKLLSPLSRARGRVRDSGDKSLFASFSSEKEGLA